MHLAFICCLFYTRFYSKHSTYTEKCSPYINTKRDRTNIAILQVKKQAYRLGKLLRHSKLESKLRYSDSVIMHSTTTV